MSLHLLSIFTDQGDIGKVFIYSQAPKSGGYVLFEVAPLQAYFLGHLASFRRFYHKTVFRLALCNPNLYICVYIYVNICNWRTFLIPSKIFPELICIFSSQCPYLAQSECYALMTNNSKAHPCFPRFLLVNFLCAWL